MVIEDGSRCVGCFWNIVGRRYGVGRRNDGGFCVGYGVFFRGRWLDEDEVGKKI